MAPFQKILIVSEQKPLIDFLRNTLHQVSDHFTVTIASSGCRALKLLRNQSIDLLLTDYILADMAGLQFLQGVKKQGSKPGFTIFISPDEFYGQALFLNNHSIIGMYLTFPDDGNKTMPLLRQALTTALEQVDNFSLP